MNMAHGTLGNSSPVTRHLPHSLSRGQQTWMYGKHDSNPSVWCYHWLSRDPVLMSGLITCLKLVLSLLCKITIITQQQKCSVVYANFASLHPLFLLIQRLIQYLFMNRKERIHQAKLWNIRLGNVLSSVRVKQLCTQLSGTETMYRTYLQRHTSNIKLFNGRTIL